MCVRPIRCLAFSRAGMTVTLDRGRLVGVEEIGISKFKATCSAVLEAVRRTRRPVLITRFGEPLAEIVPYPVVKRPEQRLGAMEGTGRICGDIVAPATDDKEWQILRP